MTILTKPGIYLPIFVFCFSLFPGCSNLSERTEDSEKPNILWIVADDLGTDIGCYGNHMVHTPNLDRLSMEGERYTNFYTVTAVCSPSRSAMITGMYPTSINAHQHRTRNKKPLPEGIYPVTHYLREAGYYICNGNYKNPLKPGKQDYNFVADTLFDGTDWSQRDLNQPFFAQVQINLPHRPFIRDSLYPVNEADVVLPPYYPDHKIARQDWALYLETVQILDREVGKIIQRLEKDHLLEKTIIFFLGDQGRPHVRAKQFMYDGGIHSPLIIRWPGRKNEGTVNAGLVSNVDLAPAIMYLANIEIPDHMQGIPFLDPDREKRTCVFLMRDRRDETVDRIRAIRSHRFKYIRNFYPDRPYTQFNAYKKQAYPVLTLMQFMYKNGTLNEIQELFMSQTRPAEELYDLSNDPWEIHNIALNPEFEDVIAEFRTIMDTFLRTCDLACYPESGEEIEYASQLMKERFKARMKEKGLSAESTNEEILAYWRKVLVPTGNK